jgi:Predicted hydrolases of the HAD superfamily
MGNGKDEVKKVATYVTSEVWSDGVLQGLKHFGLVE